MTDHEQELEDDPSGISDEGLEEELTIAASGSEHDAGREDRLDELLEEREHRSRDEA